MTYANDAVKEVPVKAGYLFLAGGGAVVVWSGVKGKRFTDVFRALVGGNNPATLPQAYNIAGVVPTAAPGTTGNVASSGFTTGTGQAPGTNTAGGRGSSSGMSQVASGSEGSFISAFLADLNAPSTPANVSSVMNWIGHEKPAGQPLQWNNPLNIGTPGSSSQGRTGTFPVGPGIAIYDNPTDGAHADAQFILNNGYNTILLLLRAGRGLKSGAASDLMRWSGGAYSSV